MQKDSSIDAVVAFDAISALGSEEADIDSYVNEVVRVLKPGGAFVFLERGAKFLYYKQYQCCYFSYYIVLFWDSISVLPFSV